MRHFFPLLALNLVAGSIAASQPVQAAVSEHWVLFMRATSDSGVRALRITWKGDSVFGESGDGLRLVGGVVNSRLTAEIRYNGGGITRLTGSRDDVGRMSGNWSGRGIRANAGSAGTWTALRTVGSPGAPDVAERWVLTRIPSADRAAGGSEPQSYHIDLTWRGDSLIGVPLLTPPLVGTSQSGRINALWMDTDTRGLILVGTRANRDSLSGTWQSYAPPARNGTWVASRIGRASPRAVSYSPTNWFTTYSSTNPPGLRVSPGDTIRLRGSSPGTGVVPAPIAVEGALPGDLLAIRILRIRPAATAHSQRSLLLDWFTTEFAQRAQAPAAAVWNWRIDTIAGVARLDTTIARGPAIQRLKAITIPLQPMIGNIGVAPEGRLAFPAPDEGDYGGNLDYKGIREGTTLYLPVFHPGGLLSVSDDHHAAQGDGELSGTGLEVAADVDIVVDVIRGADVAHVRAEDATHRYAFGVSADLSRALRLANTHLSEWLQADFRLTQQDLALLLGAGIELDIANVWGTQTTVVAKIKKSLLAQIAR